MVIEALLPHAGAMVLLDSVLAWDERGIRCAARSHLDLNNPLRAHGRLAALCGAEYALQAAALHGALRAGGTAQAAGYLARLRDLVLRVERLDDPALGTLGIEARLERAEGAGMSYELSVTCQAGSLLLSAAATIAVPGLAQVHGAGRGWGTQA